MAHHLDADLEQTYFIDLLQQFICLFDHACHRYEGILYKLPELCLDHFVHRLLRKKVFEDPNDELAIVHGMAPAKGSGGTTKLEQKRKNG